MKKLVIALVILVAAGTAYWYAKQDKTEQQVADHGAVGMVYQCSDGGVVTANFSEGVANVTLPDGRKVELDGVVAASGEKYANTGEAIVFWRKGEEAFVMENGKLTHEKCIEQLSQ